MHAPVRNFKWLRSTVESKNCVTVVSKLKKKMNILHAVSACANSEKLLFLHISVTY